MFLSWYFDLEVNGSVPFEVIVAYATTCVPSWEEVNHSPRQIIMTDDSGWDPFTVEQRSRLREEEKYRSTASSERFERIESVDTSRLSRQTSVFDVILRVFDVILRVL